MSVVWGSPSGEGLSTTLACPPTDPVRGASVQVTEGKSYLRKNKRTDPGGPAAPFGPSSPLGPLRVQKSRGFGSEPSVVPGSETDVPDRWTTGGTQYGTRTRPRGGGRFRSTAKDSGVVGHDGKAPKNRKC